MIPFFKKKSAALPDFWQVYEATFKEKQPEEIARARFVVLDTETTGFDYDHDRILCIGALILESQTIAVKKVMEVYIKQDYYNRETAKIHGILKDGNTIQVSELAALKDFLVYVGNAVIIAHHAKFDITMINRALHRNGLPHLKNVVLDTSTLYKKTLIQSPLITKKEQYSLDELADKFDISKKDRHTAVGDAYITALLFLKILSKLREKKITSLQQLI